MQSNRSATAPRDTTFAGMVGSILLIFACTWMAASGQTTFEAISVKPSPPDGVINYFDGAAEEAIRFRGGPGTKSPERIYYAGVTLKLLLRRAYNVSPEQILGPNWLSTERYDINGVLPPGTTTDQLRSMLQILLQQRFDMRVQRQTKALPVYVLELSEEPTKLRAVTDSAVSLSESEMREKASTLITDMRTRGFNKSIGIAKGSVEQFIARLASHLDRPVKDMTGLTGMYAFNLSWDSGSSYAAGEFSAPDLFRALKEQLGLRLTRRTDNIDVIVVEHANRIPTAN